MTLHARITERLDGLEKDLDAATSRSWVIQTDNADITLPFDHDNLSRDLIAGFRMVLAEHSEEDDGACRGCGASFDEEWRTGNIDDCATLHGLAKALQVDASEHSGTEAGQ